MNILTKLDNFYSEEKKNSKHFYYTETELGPVSASLNVTLFLEHVVCNTPVHLILDPQMSCPSPYQNLIVGRQR